MMENTYTYTARNADNPDQVVTFTLHDHALSVGIGVPLEHVERAIRAKTAETEAESEYPVRPWLRPMAISMVERATRPFDVDDVDARSVDDWLQVRAWFRTGGLRLMPITLIKGRVDNPEAAQAFIQELDERKASARGLARFLDVLDYWATWFIAGFLMVVFLETWRRRRGGEVG
jgi:hypothetical protein